MTMPHLMNCNHAADGWCLDCVKTLHDDGERVYTDYLHALALAVAASEFAADRISTREFIEQVIVYEEGLNSAYLDLQKSPPA